MPPIRPTVTRRRLLQGSAAGIALATAPILRPAPALAAGQARLRLLETSDIHVYIYPYDYYRDAEDATVGYARVASLVRAARAEVQNSLLLDNGDFLQGSPMGDYMAYEKRLEGDASHPMIRAMTALGVEAATLGNHEFNYGLPFLEKALAGADFPFVLANVARGRLGASPTADRTLVRPWAILEREIVDGAGARHPIRIGVIGFTPPQIMSWDAVHLAGNVEVRDIVSAAKARVPELKEAGADIVVALSHSGIAGGSPDGAENASLHLAAIPGVDVILTGHQHLVFPGKDLAGIEGADAATGRLLGKPAVQPGFWGSHLGIVDLVLERDGRGWRVLDSTVQTRPIYERVERQPRPLVEPQPAILALVRPEHEGTLAYVRRPVGRSSVPITSYFALIADSAAVQIVNDAQVWYAKQLVAGGPHASLPVLGAAAPFKAGGRGGPAYFTDVPAGDLAIRNIADIYLYPNLLRVVLVDGATVKEWLERSAGLFNRIDPAGGEQALIDPKFPAFNFDVIDGVAYTIDVTRPSRYSAEGKLVDPAAERIRDLRFAGRPIDPRQSFLVVTNSYRASGGGSFPGLDGSNVVVEAPDMNRDAIVRYVQAMGTVAPRADGNWGLAPTTGAASLLYVTGPAAERHAAEAAGLATLQGPDADGFVRFTVKPAG